MLAHMDGEKIEVWDTDTMEWRPAKPEEIIPALVVIVAKLNTKLKRLAD